MNVNDKTEEIPAQFLPGSALPRYVERLDDVEWVTIRRKDNIVARTMALVAIVVGVCLLVIGFAWRVDARPPADQFPNGPWPVPTASPHERPAAWVPPEVDR